MQRLRLSRRREVVLADSIRSLDHAEHAACSGFRHGEAFKIGEARPFASEAIAVFNLPRSVTGSYQRPDLAVRPRAVTTNPGSLGDLVIRRAAEIVVEVVASRSFHRGEVDRVARRFGRPGILRSG